MKQARLEFNHFKSLIEDAILDHENYKLEWV